MINKETNIDNTTDDIGKQAVYDSLREWLSLVEIYHHAIAVLQHQLPKTAKLVEDSAKTMSDRFTSLAKDIKQQSSVLEQISEVSNTINVGNEKITIEGFTNLFSETLSDSIEKILFVSKRAVSMIYTLDEAMKNIASIETFVTDIRNITKKANLLALNASIEAARAGEAGKGFSVVANEVKEVSNTIREIAESVNSRIETVRDGVKDGYQALQDVANTDMSQTIIEQDRLSSMMDSLIEQKNKFSEVLKKSAGITEGASETLSKMVVNMQFQDRTNQYIESSINLLKFMDDNIMSLKEANMRLIPVLSSIETDKSLIKKIQDQFTLSEFAKLFEESLSGIDINSAPTHFNSADDYNDKKIDIELF